MERSNPSRRLREMASASVHRRAVECPDVLRIPDLRVPPAETSRLKRALVGAHVELALPTTGVAAHDSLLACFGDRLSGREPLVWQDGDRVNFAFGVLGHEERGRVEEFAEAVARTLGANVVFATTVGMVVPVDASFLT